MGFVAGLIAVFLGCIVAVIITVIYAVVKKRKMNDMSNTKLILSSLVVLVISTLIAIPSVFYLLFLMYSEVA
jgi:ethanolamine transporter EutH